MVYHNKGMFVRLVYLLVSLISFYTKKIMRSSTSGVIVLCYHGVKNSQRNAFDKQMSMISKKCISSKNLFNKEYKTNNKVSVCLTFDDALTNILDNVVPVISKKRVPITIFVSTGSMKKNPLWLRNIIHADSNERVMSESQIKKYQNNKLIKFGSHTINHPRLSQLKDKDLRKELSISKKSMQAILGYDVDELALPYGDFNKNVLRTALREGYRKIYTLEPIIYNPFNKKDSNIIGRFLMSPDAWPIEFYLTVNGSYSWLLRWRLFIKKCLFSIKGAENE